MTEMLAHPSEQQALHQQGLLPAQFGPEGHLDHPPFAPPVPDIEPQQHEAAPLTPEALDLHLSDQVKEGMFDLLQSGDIEQLKKYDEISNVLTTSEKQDFKTYRDARLGLSQAAAQETTIQEEAPQQSKGVDFKAVYTGQTNENGVRKAVVIPKNPADQVGWATSEYNTGELSVEQARQALATPEAVDAYVTRKAAILAEKTTQLKLEEAPPEVSPEASSEAADLLLHSLKLRNPQAFERQYAAMTPEDQRRFDKFEAREYVIAKSHFKQNGASEADMRKVVPDAKPLWVSVNPARFDVSEKPEDER